ncbi:hypothetical protein RyT2_24950 [Pseudolactococcus yaeyamensis]
MTDKRLRKIKNLLDLANDANDEESRTALAIAQELMMTYEISEEDLFSYKEQERLNEVITTVVHSGKPHKWLYRLARIIARNFRVKYYCLESEIIEFCFLGLTSDVQIAEVVFQYAKGSVAYFARAYMQQPEIKRKRKRKWQMRQDYIQGYLLGLSEVLEQQVAEKSYELALQLPAVVKYEVEQLGLTTSNKDTSHDIKDYDAARSGYREGLKFKSRDQIGERNEKS